jgi:hypothetical protein
VQCARHAACWHDTATQIQHTTARRRVASKDLRLHGPTEATGALNRVERTRPSEA